MRPHSLEVTAFGAFAGTVRVDFDDLAGGGLFLLHGETGAGKSTLLDAVGFALYGRVPGERGAAKRQRSDHSAATERTSVCLEATVAGRRLRITRTPEQARAKKRGTGTTTEQASVLLEQRDGSTWTTLSTRVGEADQELLDRLGMSAEQFFQVILLPQGEFARFLRAPSEQRADLLERLFGTERFRDVEAWLADRRRRSAAELEQRVEAIRTASALVAQIAEIEPPEGVPEPVWGTDLCVQHAAGVETAAKVLSAAIAAVQAARSSAEATRALAGKQQRRREALLAREELAGSAVLVAALTAEADAAGRAAEVAPALRAATVAADAIAQAQENALAAVERSAALAVAAATPAALRKAAKEQLTLRGGLEKLHGLAAEADAEDAAAALARAAAAAARVEASTAARSIAELTTKREKLLAGHTAALAAAEELPQATRLAGLLAEATAVQSQLGPAESTCAELVPRRLAAKECELGLHQDYLKVRQERLDSMIAELAARLTDDSPCPVCGSLDHPDVPVLSRSSVGLAQEDAALAAFETARAVSDKLATDLALAQATTATLQERRIAILGDLADFDLPAEVVGTAQAAEQAAAQLARVRKSADALAGVDADLAAVDQRLAEAGRTSTSAEERALAHDREAAGAAERAAGRRAELVKQLGDSPDLATALDRTGRIAEAADAAADALEALARAQATLVEAQAEAERAAVMAGFAEVADAAHAVRGAAWRDRARASIDAHRDAVSGNAALLADPDLDVDLTRPADVPAAEAAEKLAAAEHDRAVRAESHAKRQVAALERTVPALSALLVDLPDIQRRATTVKSLADLTSGQGANAKRMTLSSYVLAARLEEIAAVAGQRLLQMTGGRYSLVHTDAGRGAKRAGLGLLARDNWTGIDRDTATLSGGETFLASLALALALADVVGAEAGGMRLDSLFIDEGFGTLDETTLDEVMDVLDGLRAGGRVVGIVSHVAELRQRIPNRLHVRKHETGSTVDVVA